MPERIAEVMTPDPVAMTDAATLHAAAVAMRDRDIGDVVVTKPDGDVCGIITDRDIVVRAIAEGVDPFSATLEDVCSEDLVTVRPDDAIATAVRTMEEHAIRRLPVMDNGTLVGIVSIGDLAVERDPDSALGEISAAPPNN
jgi:CBS domain-containing protein